MQMFFWEQYLELHYAHTAALWVAHMVYVYMFAYSVCVDGVARVLRFVFVYTFQFFLFSFCYYINLNM